MTWNPQDLLTLLNATIVDTGETELGNHTTFAFSDPLMKFELLVNTGGEVEGIFLAADPERPIQGLPFFETSLNCCRIAPFPRSGMPPGLGFFVGENWRDIRFTITRREDGYISLSGAWP
ncbi:MAG TPA: hypothetical protein VF773_17570 [Verrucomicrobiae bacterium]